MNTSTEDTPNDDQDDNVTDNASKVAALAQSIADDAKEKVNKKPKRQPKRPQAKQPTYRRPSAPTARRAVQGDLFGKGDGGVKHTEAAPKGHPDVPPSGRNMDGAPIDPDGDYAYALTFTVYSHPSDHRSIEEFGQDIEDALKAEDASRARLLARSYVVGKEQISKVEFERRAAKWSND